MEKISQLMDGELEAQECEVHIRRLAQQVELARRWDQYHLIRDVLRAEAGTRVDLIASVRARLQAEPTIVAPRRRLQEAMARFALPVAAAVTGIVIGGWWTSQTPTPSVAAGDKPGVTTVAETKLPKPGPMPAVAQSNEQFGDYLLAHHEASGAAVYGRTTRDVDAGQ
jgi:sigma-E factor negative regulatory protein RseA